MAEVETRIEKAAGATTKPEVKSKIVEFLWYMKKQGYAEVTGENYVRILDILAKKGADLSDPESVKKIVAMQESWSKGRKWNVVKAYTLFLKTQGLKWEKPKYTPVERIPFIPTEIEIDELIAACSKQMATFLQVLKETGARRGEAFNLKWTDLDFAAGTLRITPEKGSNPRIFKMTPKLIAMLNNLPRISDKIWVYKSTLNLERGFRRQRARIAHKLGNPRILQIHCHTLRHWKATVEYAKTKSILYVQHLLGHRTPKTTWRYTQLVEFPHEEEYICEAAGNTEQAKKLIESGFEYVTDVDSVKLFKKRKTTFLGS